MQQAVHIINNTGHNDSLSFMSFVTASPMTSFSAMSVHKPCSKFNDGFSLLEDNLGELDIVDTRQFMMTGNINDSSGHIKQVSQASQASQVNQVSKGSQASQINQPRLANQGRLSTHNVQDCIIIEDLPTRISATYTEDYNIRYVDSVIRKKLQQDKYTRLKDLRNQHKYLEGRNQTPQKYIDKLCTQFALAKLQAEIIAIESGENLESYDSLVHDILVEYSKYEGLVKTIMLDNDKEARPQPLDNRTRHRLFLIERYLEIASRYIDIDIVRVVDAVVDCCTFCRASLAKIAPSEEGTIRCQECQTEHDIVILAKLAKDGARINISNTTDDESIENFLRAFDRYQGVRSEYPHESLYEELDEYFVRNDRPVGSTIRQLPLNDRGRRGDTNHKMLWSALSSIDRSEHYENANLIGHIYWGWELPDVMQFRETIINHYNKTQKVFYQIPSEIRGRNSSLGTQYRLWRHLQLVGYICHPDEFKIAENPESLRTHNKLWKLMCEGANDTSIYYIA